VSPSGVTSAKPPLTKIRRSAPSLITFSAPGLIVLITGAWFGDTPNSPSEPGTTT
jgi:hypothetical protein